MNLVFFEQSLMVYGAQIGRWPPALQAPGQALLVGSDVMATQAQALLRQARDFDNLISSAGTPVGAADAADLAEFIWLCPAVQSQPRKQLRLLLMWQRWLFLRLRMGGRSFSRWIGGWLPPGVFARPANHGWHPLLGPTTLALGAVAAGCLMGLQLPDLLSLPGLAGSSASKVNAITLIFSV